MLLVNQTFLAKTHACMDSISICDEQGPLPSNEMVDLFIAKYGNQSEFGIVYWASKYMQKNYWKCAMYALSFNGGEHLTKSELRALAIHAVNVVLRKYYANEAASINRSVRNL